MNKKEIINKLKEYDLDKNEFVILSSSAMILKDIKNETSDIDIAVTSKYNDILLNNYNCKLEKEIKDNGKLYKSYMIDDIINFSTHYYNEYEYEEIDGYKIQKPEEVLKLKTKLNRDKDQKDIELIKKYLKVKSMNSLALAYLGDAVYEFYIRSYLVQSNLKVKDLQAKSVNYVSAKAQSKFLDEMMNDGFLSDEEIEIIKRARNHKSHSSKSTDIITYKKSTGLEALIGYLKLINNDQRIKEIMKYIVGD